MAWRKLVVFTFGLILINVLVAGCTKETESPSSPAVSQTVDPETPLTVLVIDDAGLGPIAARQWSARENGELRVINQSAQQLTENDFEISENVDVLIYPPRLLGELESRQLLMPLPKWIWDSEEFNREGLLRHHRMTITRHGTDNWAVPLGGPQWSLIYNEDVLKELGGKPPTDWDQLIELANKIRDRGSDGDGGGKSLLEIVELPLAEGWAVQTFLARASPLIRNRGKLSSVFDRQNMKPLITGPSFVKALTDLKTLAGDEPNLGLSPGDIFKHVLSGQTAIGMTWPNKYFSGEAGKLDQPAQLVISSLPGSSQWYDLQSQQWNERSGDDDPQVDLVGFAGLMASVPQSSRNHRQAFGFLEWLSSKSISPLVTSNSPMAGPFRASQLGNPAQWTGDLISEDNSQQYADVVRTANEQTIVFQFPRLPGHDEYLKALDQNVRACLRGEFDPATALENAANDWEEITLRHGRDKQTAELRKDTGM